MCGGVGFLGGTGSWAYPQYGLMVPFGFLTFGNRVNNINFSFGYGALFSEEREPYIINQATERSSFQFGFTGLRFEGEFVPVPIPMIQWFRAI